ncbi:TolC family protein [Flavobacterium sp. RSB2_4_14]|uniref:TolC family protein n=1 Tax=Flavobacterium sp. RSB2_4_14 TaxID=3447665 RepID=UPI003F2B0F30
MVYSQEYDLGNLRIIKLEEALKLGIQNNRQLKIANTNVAIANEDLSQAKISKAPRLGLNMDYNYIGNPKVYEGFYENSVTVDYFDYQTVGSVVASMPLYYGGLIKNKIESQKLVTQIQETVVKMTEAEIKLAVTQQFFSLEKLYQQIEVTKKNIINIELRIKQLKSRVANGQNLKSDLLRTELQQSNFQVSVFQDINNIKLVSNYLDILIGLPTDTILRPELVEDIIPSKELSLDEILSEAYQNRYEIKLSETNIKLYESFLNSTKSGFKPNINANFIFNSQYPAQWPNYINNTLNFWAAGLSLNWDISSFYNLKHRVGSDKLQIEKSNTQLQITKDEIDKEVKKALVRYAENKKNIPTFIKNVELAQNNYKIVKSRYDNDFALISDMVDAELQLNAAKISLINSNLDLIIQFYSLKYAMGKL